MLYKVLESEFVAQVGTVIELTDRQAEIFVGKVETEAPVVPAPNAPVVPPAEPAGLSVPVETPPTPEVPPVVPEVPTVSAPAAPIDPETVTASTPVPQKSWVGGHIVNNGVHEQ